ncbi:MAG: hypothetical protein JXA71_16985 [Chitinispirillaceae bacterium]|nr:hypothetical protein [Chitinispirillaceae bacterium]
MTRKRIDPRESLADKLIDKGIDGQSAYMIALDAGLGVVDRECLVEIGLKDTKLDAAEKLMAKFYWDEESFT